VYREDHKQYTCLLLAAKHSPSLDMLPLLVRTTLQQAKQQQQQQQQRPWAEVLYDLVKAPLACRPRRAAIVLQQVMKLEGAAAAAGVVERLLNKYTQLQQHQRMRALTHLAMVLVLVWLGACGEVVQQRVTLVTPLQQACGVVPPPQGQQPPQQPAGELSMVPGWGLVQTALEEVMSAAAAAAPAAAAAAAAAAEDSADDSDDGDSSAYEDDMQTYNVYLDDPQTIKQNLKQHLQHLKAAMQRVMELHASEAGASGSKKQLCQRQQEVENNTWAAADALADLFCPFSTGGDYAAVEAAAAGLCRQLLVGWLAAREQLRQEMVEAVVDAAPVMAAGARKQKRATRSWWSTLESACKT
jgi:hypothetical protein